ncbi:MAG: bacillithiol biosynthesis BshC, partial [Bdellovibrionales bacterium]|nr:bacillithiol biosynthesis BshC [Bdellovibrionales bacterium]
DKLVRTLEPVDPTIAQSADKSRGKALQLVDRLQERYEQSVGRHDATLADRIEKIRRELYPLEAPQERVFGLVSYLLRIGPSFLDRVMSVVDPFLDEAATMNREIRL